MSFIYFLGEAKKDLYSLPKSIALIFSVLMLLSCSNEDPQKVNAQHLQRATAYQGSGQYKAAIIEYKNAVKKSGGALDVIVQYADMINEIGQFPVALELLEQVSGEKNERYYLELVETYIGLRKFKSAGAVLDDLGAIDNADKLLLDAKVLSGLGKLREAQAIYEQVLNLDAQNGLARLGLATSLARQASMNEAVLELRKIEEGNDSYVPALVLIAGIEISLEQLDKAEATLSDALFRLPNTDLMLPQKAFVLERLSYVLTRLGRSNEAYIYTKLLAEAFPGANEVGEQYKDAVEAFQMRDLDKAQALLNSILVNYPAHKKAKQLLGIISYLEGETNTASALLSESVDPEVADPLTTHIYAATNLKLNEPKKVLEILEPSIADTTSASTLALYGLAAISDKQFSKGESALKKAAKLAPEDVRIRLALASFYRSGEPPKVKAELAQLEEAFAINPLDRQVLADLIGHYLRHEQNSKAADFITDLVKSYPTAYAPNLVAGYYYISRQELSKAQPRFEKALQAKAQADDYSEALYAKGRTELSLKDLASAEKTFLQMAKVYPANELSYRGLYSVYRVQYDDSYASEKLDALAQRSAQIAPYLVLVSAFMGEQKLDAAKLYHDKARVLKPDDLVLEKVGIAIQFAEVRAAMGAQDYVAAREKIAPLLLREPDNIRLLSLVVELDIRDGQYVEAAKILKQIELIDARHPITMVLKGDLAKSQQDWQGAREAYASSWEHAPTNLVAEQLFSVLGRLGDTAAQAKHLQRWLELFPGSEKATLLQAIRYQEQAQQSKAAKLYEKVLQTQANNVTALNNLGWIYFEKGDEQALLTLAKAAELAPENPAVLDSYGWVLYKFGQVEKGQKYLEKASALAPEVKEIAEHLAQAKQ